MESGWSGQDGRLGEFGRADALSTDQVENSWILYEISIVRDWLSQLLWNFYRVLGF